MPQARFETWHRDLQELLGLAVPPVAIAFIGQRPGSLGHQRRGGSSSAPAGRSPGEEKAQRRTKH